ncbi:MAG: NAD(+)/NADH kinase [Pseudomonadota bacterium]
MPEIKKVLIVRKLSTYETFSLEKSNLSKKQLEKYEKYHLENLETIEKVKAVLENLSIKYKIKKRTEVKKISKQDLVISIGGDGTFFDTARLVKDIPIISINSNKMGSVALFSSMDISNIEKKLYKLLTKPLIPLFLNRMQIILNNKILDDFILNDILIANASPVNMSKYIISIDGIRESQRSSGVWISTAAGSTGGIFSAGAKALPLGSKRLQFLIREPVNKRLYKYSKGFIKEGQKFNIISKMPNGKIYLDGSTKYYSFNIQDKCSLVISPHPLKILGFDKKKRNSYVSS